MDAGALTLLASATGAGYFGLARWVDRNRAEEAPEEAHDFYVLGWYALAATGFLAAAQAAAIGGGWDDLVLLLTLKLGIALAFVIAIASLVAATANLVTASAAVKARASARRA